MLGLIAAALVGLVFLALGMRFDRKNPRAGLQVRRPGVLVLGVGVTLFTLSFVNSCFLSVPAAHIATVYDPLRGGVQDLHLPEGFHLVMPWWQTQTFRVQTQEYTMSGTTHEGQVRGDDSIFCQTNEGLGLRLEVTVLYHINAKTAHTLWQTIGNSSEYQSILVRPLTRNAIRMVTARYSVVDVYGARRQQIEREINNEIKEAFAAKGLELEGVLLRNVDFANPEFAQAITDKQVAQQQINTEAQNLQRARVEKQTAIAQAGGEAESITKRGATLRANPEVVQYEMAQKLAPRVKSIYLSPQFLPVLPSGNAANGNAAKGGR